MSEGTEPMELEVSIRYICEHYVSMHKNEGKLLEGLRRLGSLRRKFLPEMTAKNPHYLMRALEARNIMDLAELHMRACLERRESRGYYAERTIRTGTLHVTPCQHTRDWKTGNRCSKSEKSRT